MKNLKLRLGILGLLVLSLLANRIAQAQTGAPPDAGQRACVNVFVPGVIIDVLDFLTLAPDDIPPLEANGALVRILPENDDEDVLPLVRLEFNMAVNDNRGVVCFFFDFQGFAEENEDASRLIRIEEVNLDDEETDCELPDDLTIPNASFSLDIYEDAGDGEDITEDNLITDFSGESDDEDEEVEEVEEPILLVTNIPAPPPFAIELRFCDENPDDDPKTDDIDESELDPEFVEVPNLQDYCDDAEEALLEAQEAGEADEDEELPAICDELIRLPQNRAIFVITNTDGYFNYAVDRP